MHVANGTSHHVLPTPPPPLAALQSALQRAPSPEDPVLPTARSTVVPADPSRSVVTDSSNSRGTGASASRYVAQYPAQHSAQHRDPAPRSSTRRRGTHDPRFAPGGPRVSPALLPVAPSTAPPPSPTRSSALASALERGSLSPAPPALPVAPVEPPPLPTPLAPVFSRTLLSRPRRRRPGDPPRHPPWCAAPCLRPRRPWFRLRSPQSRPRHRRIR